MMGLSTLLCYLFVLVLVVHISFTCAQPRAEVIIKTLQDQYYDEATGLWKQPSGWWNSANALEALVEYTIYSKDRQFLSAVENTFQHTTTPETEAEYFDDAQWWAIAWIRAYELTEDLKYRDRSVAIWNYVMSKAWDDTCGGGVWWSEARNYKNAITNELFLTLSTLLYLHSQNSTYLHWANMEWAWFQKSGMINRENLINDGLTSSCENNGGITWTYNQGVILGGLTYLGMITGNSSLVVVAQNIADAVYKTLVYTEGGVLRENCDTTPNGCDGDAAQFKGVFVRYLGILASQKPPIPNKNKYTTWLSVNADSIWDKDKTADGRCGDKWLGPFTEATATTQTSALDCFNALMLLGE